MKHLEYEIRKCCITLTKIGLAKCSIYTLPTVQEIYFFLVLDSLCLKFASYYCLGDIVKCCVYVWEH